MYLPEVQELHAPKQFNMTYLEKPSQNIVH